MAKSTTPQPFSLFPKSIKCGLKLLHFFSERAAFGVLYRLFFLPRPHQTPEREKIYQEQWTWIQETTPWGVLPVAVAAAAVICPFQGRVLVLHGWSGRPTQMGGVVAALQSAGFECWVPVAPGHVAGQTGFSSLRDFAQFASWMQENHGPFFAGVGHSLGGGALLMSTEHGSTWQRLVTISAFGKTERVFHEFVQQSGLPQRYVDRLFARVTRELGSDPHFYSPHLAKHTGALLILHSPDDVEVPFNDAECLRDHFPQSTLIATSPLGHRKILWRAETWEAVVGYLHQ